MSKTAWSGIISVLSFLWAWKIYELSNDLNYWDKIYKCKSITDSWASFDCSARMFNQMGADRPWMWVLIIIGVGSALVFLSSLASDE